VAAIAAVEQVSLERPVTLLAGENGSGKSTVLEAIAEAIGFGEQGGELERLGELPAVPRNVLGGALAPVLTATKLLLACPHARVYELDGGSVTTPDYDDLQAVSLTRAFLAAPERYLMALDSDALEEDG
jgi:predicted ATPase